jgi:hypothetical protein
VPLEVVELLQTHEKPTSLLYADTSAIHDRPI